MDKIVDRKFFDYIENEFNTSAESEELDKKLSNLESNFLENIGSEHKERLLEFVTEITSMFLAFGFEAGYNAK